MMASKRERDAARLVRALQKVGFHFALLNWSRFALLGGRLSRRTRRRIEKLQPEILRLLQAATIEVLQKEAVQAATAPTKPGERPTLVQ
jgi:hypothetical protein